MTAIVGTAGWSMPRDVVDRFGSGGSVLERYATRFGGVEVNSSFYRAHRPRTWARWAASTPPAFRFAVKMPRMISHDRKLIDCAEPLERFLDEAGALGDKLAVLLLQLPPKFAFDADRFESFVGLVRGRSDVPLVCEPRHPDWFAPDVDRLLDRIGVARVGADPACVPDAAHPGGWRGLSYRRLHGSPQRYRSSYADRLDPLADALRAEAAAPAWCIFDNTASGAATRDALGLLDRLTRRADQRFRCSSTAAALFPTASTARCSSSRFTPNLSVQYATS